MGVVVITVAVAIAAACSDEDTVDTIPPPWPNPTEQSLDGTYAPSSTGTPASSAATSMPVITITP